jgi:hypothetical protein
MWMRIGGNKLSGLIRGQRLKTSTAKPTDAKLTAINCGKSTHSKN